ncbi:MAG: Asp-tRNA(Asn)/Glu-tRNA(Gln) amidotransferase subunit GatA [Planctomycetes bacterium]|nr:Asp-tRNA(Asn)/Glu-tRNA(Gln) amidotransferase subunit GatA [Planctomycetota bacterium]
MPLSASQMVEAVLAGNASPGHFAETACKHLETTGRELGAVLDVNRQRMEERVAALTARLQAGEKPPLAGVPIGIKDNICTLRERTSCGSKILENYCAPYDATVIERLEAAGAIPVGKLNMDEFAMGSSTENSAYGPCRNPWDLQRTPGGSSGGSAAVVAAGCVPVALGSDTGGSIRQPAAFTGTVGLKPTYGRVSRYGLVAFGSSLDQIGPLATNVEDAARIYAAMAGRDERDATSQAAAVEDPLAQLDAGVRGLRIGVPREYMSDAIDARIRARIEQTLQQLAEQGAILVDVTLPHTPYAIPTYYIVATAEASSNLARHDGMHQGVRAPGSTDLLSCYLKNRGQGLGREVQRRILLGTFCLSAGYYDAYYDRAMRVRTLLAQDFETAFVRCDVVLGATTPTLPFRLGEKVADPLQMYLADILTASANLAGIPALVVPAGTIDEAGTALPVGVQLMGPALSEALLLRVGRGVERAAGGPLPVAPHGVRS